MEPTTKVFIFLTLVAVSSCYRDDPEKCCTDDQFETSYGGIIAQIQGDMALGILQDMKLGYDVKGQRVGSEASYYILDGPTFNIKTIQLWDQKKTYTILNGACTVTPLEDPAPVNCVPDDAKFSEYIYQGKDELLLQSWVLNAKPYGLRGIMFESITDKTCTPVGNSFVGVAQSGMYEMPMSYSSGYYNFTSGIQDPSKWFDIPDLCDKADLKQTPYNGLDMLHPLLKIAHKISMRLF
ncbi:Development-specific protein LVN1.2 [Holothuria leucospilota]|uniref:Development-specific protein LVN1.2 n=1 Tax=Holothuria leucospilota TaxID=206669 RepID=A0A9Q1BQC8_HOLLE|nr:Development-specific protein LVN1.2 [Holothuria leucospilota]